MKSYQIEAQKSEKARWKVEDEKEKTRRESKEITVVCGW